MAPPRRRLFRIDLRVQAPKGQRKCHARCVQGRARVCTSMVSVAPTRINLGDCDIQAPKRATALVRNLSDLPAKLSISMHSKVLSTPDDQVTIAPQTSCAPSRAVEPRALRSSRSLPARAEPPASTQTTSSSISCRDA